MRTGTTLALVAAALLSHGCAEPDPAATATATATIGPDGGVVEAPGVRLVVPPGALPFQEQISIAIADLDGAVGFGRASAVYRFTPDGLGFALPVQVGIELAGEVADAEIRWYSRDRGVYEPLPSARDGRRVTTQVTALSRGYAAAR